MEAEADDVASALALRDNRFDLGSIQPADGGQKRPLIGVWNELLVDEHAVALLTGLLLQRKRNEIPKSTVRQRVLAREEAVVRLESDIGSSLHRFGQDIGAEPARQRRWNGVLKEEPDVPAAAGA